MPAWHKQAVSVGHLAFGAGVRVGLLDHLHKVLLAGVGESRPQSKYRIIGQKVRCTLLALI